MKKPEKKEGKKVKNKIIGYSFGLLVIVMVVLFIYYRNSNENKYIDEPIKFYEPPFTKNGQLSFVKKSNNDTVKTIDIEISDTEEKRAQGLMWRRSMSDEVGMLFIFEEEEPQSFWMKNTYIPLDIIFVNKLNEIVTIHDYATPLSERSIPSSAPVQFVVEVNAGFCFKYKIDNGDRIKFKVQN